MDAACKKAFILSTIEDYEQNDALYLLAPYIPWSIISQMLDKNWNWDQLSKNKDLTIDIVKQHVTFWDWFSISSHRNITLSDVLENPDLPWNWSGLSSNPSITRPIKEQHPELPWTTKCYIHPTSPRAFHPWPCFKMEFVRRWRAQKVIKRYWFRAITDPTYQVCRKRLMREFLQDVE